MPNIEHFKTHENYLQYYRDYRERNRKKIRAYNLLYIRKKRKTMDYEKRGKVTGTLNYAVKTKKVFKIPCVVCGNEKVQGHHNNYNRPLDVIWLCPMHHKWVHKLFSKEELEKIKKPKLMIDVIIKLDKMKYKKVIHTPH